jgi:predicted alpha/beta superfamily hydrolase
MYQSLVRINYPFQNGRIVLRSEQNWHEDLEATAVSNNGERYEFQVSHDRPFLHYKPCIRNGQQLFWSEGTNKLLILTAAKPVDNYPYFYSGAQGEITGVIEIPSAILQRNHRFRVYLPPGYNENHLKRYPVLYMHDGSNLFFPEEAFLGQEWRIDESLNLMDTMNLIDQVIIVGIHAGDRFEEYTQPGYEGYGKALVEELKPSIDANLRTLADAQHTGVMGSSLGGVVSFFLAWEWPEVFGSAACLSGTFSYQDDLIDRVRSESIASRKDLKIYLDSGWPEDNYEVTLSMAAALLESGFSFGNNFFHFAFPLAQHNEAAWGARVHLPLQLFAGKLKRAPLQKGNPA